MDRTSVRAQLDISRRKVFVYIFDDSFPNSDRYGVAVNVEMRSINSGDDVPATPIAMEPEAAQQLIDDLWRDGFRPADYKFTSETVEAKGEHIGDLRKELDRVHALLALASKEPADDTAE